LLWSKTFAVLPCSCRATICGGCCAPVTSHLSIVFVSCQRNEVFGTYIILQSIRLLAAWRLALTSCVTAASITAKTMRSSLYFTLLIRWGVIRNVCVSCYPSQILGAATTDLLFCSEFRLNLHDDLTDSSLCSLGRFSMPYKCHFEMRSFSPWKSPNLYSEHKSMSPEPSSIWRIVTVVNSLFLVFVFSAPACLLQGMWNTFLLCILSVYQMTL